MEVKEMNGRHNGGMEVKEMNGKQSASLTNGADLTSLTAYRWEEINKHTEKSSRWLVIDRLVYDVTSWSKRHPGGSTILGHFAGQDASEPFEAFHRNSVTQVRKFLKPLLIGRLAEDETVTDLEIRKDFNDLRLTAERLGFFKSSFWFFFLSILQVIVLDVSSYLVLRYFGNSWMIWIVSVILAATAQVQVGWYQHDVGHLSMFKNNTRNRIYHIFLMGVIKGVSAHWWNHMHYQHHSKPNILGKDPDVRMEKVFLLGELMPVEIAKNQPDAPMPYNKQHKYFFLIGPPLLFPIYFQFMAFRHAYTRRLWLEGFLMVTYYIRFFAMYAPLLGGFWACLFYYEVMRVIESHWFTWVTQSNHIPMTTTKDDVNSKAWLVSQLMATCNIEGSAFNDWFTGHLNFQIEHHLFPQMPRHSYYKIAPLVKSLCEKHQVEYKVKTLSGAFGDIIKHGYYGTISRSTASEENLLSASVSVVHSGDYLPQSARRSALTCILLCQFFSWISFNAILLWIPQIMLIVPTTKNGSKVDRIENKMFVVLGMASVVAGITMDNWIKKSRVLIVGVLTACGGIIGVTILAIIEENNSGLYFTTFCTILMITSAMESVIRVALPTLGGDQIPAKTDVRLFYAAFYWCQKAGETISSAIYTYILFDYQYTCLPNMGWPIMIFAAAGLGITSALLVSCGKWIRQVRADSSVIKNPINICKEAFQRRKERAEGDHFLSTAQLGRGGSFPDSLVDEMTRLFKFIIVLACLLPVTFAANNVPFLEKRCYLNKTSGNNGTNCQKLHIQDSPYPEAKTMIFPLIIFSSVLVAIPIIHVSCVWLSKKGYPPSLLHRFIAGHVVMVCGNTASLLYTFFHWCGFDSLAVPPTLTGFCKAFIYTTGYELTLLSAPRSMQGTAMGLFYFMDGISSLIYMEITNMDSQKILISGGIAAPVLGLLILVFIEKKFDLGLSKQ